MNNRHERRKLRSHSLRGQLRALQRKPLDIPDYNHIENAMCVTVAVHDGDRCCASISVCPINDTLYEQLAWIENANDPALNDEIRKVLPNLVTERQDDAATRGGLRLAWANEQIRIGVHEMIKERGRACITIAIDVELGIFELIVSNFFRNPFEDDYELETLQ